MDSVLDDVNCDKSTENHGSSAHHKEVARDEELRCGLNVDLDFLQHQHEPFSDTLLWLKTVAIDHYMEDTSTRNFKERSSQILKAKEFLCEARSRKRKLRQLLQERVTVASDLSTGKPKKRTPAKRRHHCLASAGAERSSGQIQNSHCSIRSSKFVDNLSQKRIPNCHSFPPDSLERRSPLDVDVQNLLGSADLVSGSNLLDTAKKHIQTSKNNPISLHKLGNTEPQKHMLTSPNKRFSPMHKPDGYVNGSHTLKFNNAKIQNSPQKLSKLCDFFGEDDPPRMAIPVGPHFQADIPNVIGPPNGNSLANGYTGSDNSEKWLGIRIWPSESKVVNISTEDIGKGRPSSCLCNSPGSTHCIDLHITEKRLQLQFDLSSAFYCWKFDQMGEEVSKLWTPNEQEQFRNLVRLNPVSEEKSFWKPAVKSFPSKPRESIVSYYFNVFVLRRMRRQTRLASEVDSDDDEIDEGAGHSKDAKQRYLTGRR